MQDPKLWARLQAHRFGGDTARFAERLAAEEGWTPGHAARVVEEYRRFLYLTRVGDAKATPSGPVDRAWHLHLTFSRDYWDRLCGEVLDRPLHHDPAEGEDDLARCRAQYAATRALYAAEFGAPPPRRIWPALPAAGRRRAGLAILAGGGAVALFGLAALAVVPGAWVALSLGALAALVGGAVYGSTLRLHRSRAFLGSCDGGDPGCGGD